MYATIFDYLNAQVHIFPLIEFKIDEKYIKTGIVDDNLISDFSDWYGTHYDEIEVIYSHNMPKVNDSFMLDSGESPTICIADSDSRHINNDINIVLFPTTLSEINDLNNGKENEIAARFGLNDIWGLTTMSFEDEIYINISDED